MESNHTMNFNNIPINEEIEFDMKNIPAPAEFVSTQIQSYLKSSDCHIISIQGTARYFENPVMVIKSNKQLNGPAWQQEPNVKEDNFKTRLLEERDQLTERSMKLEQFLKSDKIGTIDPAQLSLLHVQSLAMRTYLQCLNERIQIL